ncbi:hypothetical protein niasHT_031499 [Heterodera trifolii]|uniref:DNA-directed DNA polymerase n=1 Tax=Heterodera trifolii TaxID=157864 RepID=A0ABD2IB30_9BILA
MGNFRLGNSTQTEHTTQIHSHNFRNGIHFFQSLIFFLCRKWRKEFLDGRYGSKQTSPPSPPRSPSPSFPIPVIVGRKMFPGDDGYESEDDEILLPPPPIPPQIAPPPPSIKCAGNFGLAFRCFFSNFRVLFQAVRVQPMHVGQQRLPRRDLPQFDYHPPNVPEIAVGLIQDGHQPMPLRVLPQIAHRQLIFPAIRVQPVQQPIPLRDVQLFDNPPPNVPVIRVQPIPQPLPMRDMAQIRHPPRNVTSIWIKLWLLFLSLWVFLQAIHIRQIQRDYAIPQFAHQPPNVPLIFDHPPAIQPRQQPLPLRDVLQFDHPQPHGPPNNPNPPRVLEVIRRLKEWRRRPRDPRRLFYALEIARSYQLIGKGITENKFRYLMKTEKKQRKLAIELMEKAGISTDDKTFGIQHLEAVQKFWDAQYPDNFRIVAFEMKTPLKPIFKGEGVRRNDICVIRDGGHWDGIKSVSWCFCVKNFCVSCEVTFWTKERHRIECKERCKKCCRMGFGFPCVEDCPEINCEECQRDFYNIQCFEEHKKLACKEYKKCENCGETHNTRNKHSCGEKFCKLCKVNHPGRQCFIKKIQVRPQKAYRIVAYDLETTVDGVEHRPNLVSAARTCNICAGEERECEICEGPRMITWSVADGFDPMSEFVLWIMGFQRFETVAFAHYAGRFDSHFVLSELTKKEIATELMMADLKIYQIKAGRVYFRDFWMLSQNRLSDLPKTLGLKTAAKLYFPHKYNKNENFGKRLTNLPSLGDYCPDNMKEEEAVKLEEWHNENFQTGFELGEQLKTYCENDVEILMESILKFRRLFLGITGDLDVIKDSVTIAGVVMKIFRTKFLKDRHPIMPEGGYERAENQSKIAVKYFEWLAQKKGVKVRHACNGGEVEFGLCLSRVSKMFFTLYSRTKRTDNEREPQ